MFRAQGEGSFVLFFVFKERKYRESFLKLNLFHLKDSLLRLYSLLTMYDENFLSWIKQGKKTRCAHCPRWAEGGRDLAILCYSLNYL
jgi:uncharacterized membrane protein